MIEAKKDRGEKRGGKGKRGKISCELNIKLWCTAYENEATDRGRGKAQVRFRDRSRRVFGLRGAQKEMRVGYDAGPEKSARREKRTGQRGCRACDGDVCKNSVATLLKPETRRRSSKLSENIQPGVRYLRHCGDPAHMA